VVHLVIRAFPWGVGWPGGTIRIARGLAPGTPDGFPPWQGLQYPRDMFSGRGRLAPLDNVRYPDIRWTPLRERLAARFAPASR